MTDSCSEVERIATMEVTMNNTVEALRDIKKTLMWFWGTFAGLMIVAIFYMGVYVKAAEYNTANVQVLQEKVSSLEDVVFTHGLYERKE